MSPRGEYGQKQYEIGSLKLLLRWNAFIRVQGLNELHVSGNRDQNPLLFPVIDEVLPRADRE